jgi:predicted RNA-binding Zn-ribbon protein involved in translation (DUF1610 family)
MSRNHRLAEGDWEQFWDEQPMEDWEDSLSAQQEFEEEVAEDWEEQNDHVYRCPRCGTKRLVDAESYSFFRTSGACEDCMWEASGGSEDDDEDSLE